MTGRTHKVIGTLAALGTASIFEISEPFAVTTLTVAGYFGGLLPDIDQPQSTISHRLWLVRLPFQIISLIYRIILFVTPLSKIQVFRTVKDNTKHRTWSHSLLFCSFWLVMYLLLCCYQVPNTITAIFLGLFIGTISHLLCDSCNGSIPLLCPVSNKQFASPLQIKQHGVCEAILRTICIVLIIALFISKHLINFLNF